MTTSRVYVGPTTLHALGDIGELDLLGSLDGDVVVLDAAADAVETEPARTALERFLEREGAGDASIPETARDRAADVVGVEAGTPEAALLAGVLARAVPGDRSAVAVVSEDSSVRRLTRGFGGAVTSSFGVVVRATTEDRYLSRTQAKRIVRRLDGRGVRMTGETREQVIGGM